MTGSRNTILVTGGAGFIGRNFVLRWIETRRRSVVNLDKLTYAGNPGNLASRRGQPRHHLRAGRHRRSRTVSKPLLQAASSARHRALRRREPRRPLDPRSRSLHADQRRRHLHAARSRFAPTGPALDDAGRDALPLPARLDRRSLWLAGARRSCVLRDDALRAEQPVRGVQGGVRSPGARLSPHLRASRC